MQVNTNDIPTGLKPFNRKEFFYPGIEKETEVHVTVSEIVGTVAKWAIQQSPYAVPDNLEIVCKELHNKLVNNFSRILNIFDAGDMLMCTVKYDNEPAVKILEKVVHNALNGIPEYLAWNERKNGNQAQLHFVSRYDGKRNPDDDFIDLGALERNVAMSLVQRYILDSRDGRVMSLDGPVEVEDR